MLRTALCVLMLAPVLALTAGCGGTACPPEIGFAGLDPETRQAFDLERIWGIATDTEPDVRGNSRYVFERGRPVQTSVRWRTGEPGPVVLPMVAQGNVWGVRVASIGLDGVEHPMTVRIDTGHAGQIAIDGTDARVGGAAVLADVPEGVHYTAFGPKASRLGVLGGLRLGDAVLEPVAPEIECGGPTFEPLLGIDLLDRFGHAIFDWEGRRLILLPAGADVAGYGRGSGWVSLPWREGARVRRTDSERKIIYDTRRATLVEIDGLQYRALLDTGFSAGLFILTPVGGLEPEGRVKVRGHGRRGWLNTGRLSGQARLGPIDLTGVEVFTADPDENGFAERTGFDMILGLEVLARRAMWLDFDAGEVRFWTGEGAPTVPGRD